MPKQKRIVGNAKGQFGASQYLHSFSDERATEPRYDKEVHGRGVYPANRVQPYRTTEYTAKKPVTAPAPTIGSHKTKSAKEKLYDKAFSKKR